MKEQIPAPIIATLSQLLPDFETHTTLDNLLMYAGASGDPPTGNKGAKVTEWLRATNADPKAKPLSVLGKVIENLMDGDFAPLNEYENKKSEAKFKIEKSLARVGLTYHQGGHVTQGGGLVAKTLEEAIKSQDLEILNLEFQKALGNVSANPRESISAACNLLESIFKIYIHDEKLEKPKSLDIQHLWGTVKPHIGLDPSKIENKDMKEIMTGIITVINGVGALRSHNSSAHGERLNSGKMSAG